MENKNQKLAKMWANEALQEMIWAYENSLEDYGPEEEDYQIAVEVLSLPLDQMVKMVADEALSSMTRVWTANNGKFAGREFIENYIKKELVKNGYPRKF
jgi:hypothetical protein